MSTNKKALAKSLLALLLCVSMLVGSTFAWFTDSVSTTANVITTGTLDIEMYWTDDLSGGNWYNVEDPATNVVFNYDKWEPGYTEVRYLKIKNAGSLALNYQLALTPVGPIGKLAEVIQVYFDEDGAAVNDKDDLDNLGALGFLDRVMNGGAYAGGTLMAADQKTPLHPSGEAIVTLAMHMIETAGNDYQNETVGGFTITALATQCAYENDSTGNQYDAGAEYPNVLNRDTAYAPVTPVGGVTTAPVTLTGNEVTATVPAGVKVQDGANQLVLNVTPLEKSSSDITVVDDEILIPVDVHVDGVAEDNTTPIVIDLGEVLPKHLNMGNYTLIHVEDGVNKPMTYVTDAADLTAHNTFTYDPLTGAVTVAMASFSEVALIAETDAAWQGKVETDFSGGTGTEEDPYLIANADQLAYFNEVISNNNDTYGDKHYKLLADVNLGGNEQKWYPIGYHKVGGTMTTVGLDDEAPAAIYLESQDQPLSFSSTAILEDMNDEHVWYTYGGAFQGVFDGNGNTISNIFQNTWSLRGDYDGHYWNDAMGLFGYVYGGTVKNLTVDSFSSDGEYTPTGVITAYAAEATFENIAVIRSNPRVYNTGNGGIVGVGGNSSDTADKALTFTNITIDNTNKISALWGSYDVACGGFMGMFRGNGKVNFTNCHVAAVMDVYNDVCANYQYYWYRYSGMLIGSVRKNTTEGGYTVANTAGITVTDSTYTMGDWNRYWYCELVKNTLASYTHDHQFSRLDEISELSDIYDGEKWLRAGNFVIPAADNSSAECYHIFADANGNLYRHTHDMSGYESFDLNGDGELNDLKEDRACYFMPFNQVLNGDGYGVKAHYAFDGFTAREDGLVKSELKFENKGVTTYRPGTTVKLGDLVNSLVYESKISKATLYAAVSPATENDKASATYTRNNGNWAESTIAFDKSCQGSVKIVITDYFYCTPTVIVLDPELAAEKFTAKGEIEKDAYTQITLGDLFAVKDGVALKGDVAASVIDPDGKETSVTGSVSDWENKTIDLTVNGEWQVIIKDADEYCETTTNIFTVNEAEKIIEKFNNENFLYRVGNANAVALGNLFAEKETAVKLTDVSVTVETQAGSASGTYTSNATWTAGTVKFSGTGVVKVTISAPGAKAVTLKLEVVDAVNATGAANATANNVVLLQDGGFGSLEVSGGYTLYGNGFTLTCGSDSAALDMGYSFVTLNNGTLDNVQIVCPNFDYAVLYKSNMTESGNRSQTTDKTRYYNVKSGVMASGNSQILNSRISGGRAAVNVTGGNVLIDNSRLELGAVATVLVGSANSLTLRDVTLVQKPTASTYDSSKILMGFSVLFVCDSAGNAAPVTIEGKLVQDAWVDEADKRYVPSAGESIISTVLGKTDYLHDLDGDGTKESLNLGFAYMPESLTSKVNTTTITDNRTNKNAVPYDYAEVSIFTGKTYVYSYKNSNGTDKSLVNVGKYIPNAYGDNITVTYSDVRDGLEAGKSLGTDGWVYELGVDLDKLSGYKLDFSKLSMSVNGVPVTDFKVNGEAKPAEPVTVVAGGTTYTLTATVDGKEYTASYKVTGTETSKESPSLVATNYAAGLCVASSYGGTWHGAAPALEGIQIKYWSVAEQQYKTINLSDYTPTTKGQLNGANTTWTCSPANGDFTLTLTGGQVHSGNNVYAMPVVCDGKLYFVAAKSSGLVNSGNSARTIPVSYSFKDNNNGDVLTFSHTWSVAENKDAQYNYSDFCKGTLTKLEASSGGGCVTPDTLITLADGSKVRVDSLTGDEQLLVWNMETGTLDSAPIMFVDSDAEAEVEVIYLHFSDGTEVKVISEHGFWDYDLNRYVYLDRYAAKYIGHTFAKQSGDELVKVQLTDVVLNNEFTSAWSPVTAGHLCYFVNDMLSMPGGVGGLFNIFEVDAETMTYDYAAMERDIATYGLLTYEEVNAIAPLSEEMFYAAGGQYLSVSIGKGNLTVQELAAMINRYSKFI